MELTPLRYFSVIAGMGHMTRAAEELGVTQPALSSSIKKLEPELGTELLHRTGKGVELTEAGAVFLQHAQETLRRADAAVEAVQELMGLERGSIRVGGGATVTTYLLPRVFSTFRRRYPGIRAYVREAGSRTVAEQVLAGELDLGVVTLPVDAPGNGDLLVIPLVDDELRLIVPPDHPLNGRKSFRWSRLDEESVVGFEGGSAVRAVIDRSAAAAGVPLNVVMELRSIESIKHMVAAGVGVGFVSRFALRKGDGLTCADGRISRQLAIVRRNDRAPSAAAAALEETMIDLVDG